MTGKRVTPVDIEVGHRIRVARNAAKMGQENLADAIGVTFQQVQKYENVENGAEFDVL
jgi:transcriptional regulator with XRE-family HTH domain